MPLHKLGDRIGQFLKRVNKPTAGLILHIGIIAATLKIELIGVTATSEVIVTLEPTIVPDVPPAGKVLAPQMAEAAERAAEAERKALVRSVVEIWRKLFE